MQVADALHDVLHMDWRNDAAKVVSVEGMMMMMMLVVVVMVMMMMMLVVVVMMMMMTTTMMMMMQAVLIADAPPHGLGEGGDGFPNGQ
jgi:hypothetical protein